MWREFVMLLLIFLAWDHFNGKKIAYQCQMLSEKKLLADKIIIHIYKIETINYLLPYSIHNNGPLFILFILFFFCFFSYFDHFDHFRSFGPNFK